MANSRATGTLSQRRNLFMPLERFPGALCDPNGYILFNSRRDYESAHYLEIGERLNVRQGIRKLPGYVRMK
jgi:hypothetical protein